MSLYDGETNIDSEAFDDPDYYFTDAIAANAERFVREHAESSPDKPFLLYTAFTSPHWPLHAREEDVERYRGRFSAGWDRLREERLERMVASGIIDPKWRLSPRDPALPAWEDAEHKEWQERRMEVYAAQVHRMDVGIGRILAALDETGQLDDTLVIYLADNGGCHEEVGDWEKWVTAARIGRSETRDGRPVRFGNRPDITPGGEDTYTSYGVPWANLSNTPFRMYKCWTHEGGISTPFIVHWPQGIAARGELRRQPGYLPDIMATLVDVTGAAYPRSREAHDVPPMEGRSLMPFIKDASAERDGLMFWEHEGNAAVRDGRWKLVRNFSARTSGTPGFDPADLRGEWELYDMIEDRSELTDLAPTNPDRVREISAAYAKWAARCGVMDRDELLDYLRARRG
jgi:arylsulfatase